MGIRQLADEKPVVIIAASALIGVLAIYLLFAWMFGGSSNTLPRVEEVYFYDIEGKTLVPVKAGEIPPLQLDNGHRAVQAYVFSCGSCDDEAQRFTGYLETYVPQVKQLLEKLASTKTQASPDELVLIQSGKVVSPPSEEKWVPLRSPEGAALVRAARSDDRCKSKGGTLVICQP